MIDPLGGETELLAETDGRLFARHSQPYAWPGRVIGKIAGEIPWKAERQLAFGLMPVAGRRLAEITTLERCSARPSGARIASAHQ